MEICSLASGSGGNCTFVSSGGTNILIDTGISLRRIKSALRSLNKSMEDISAILITHEHSDHTKALRMISKYYNTPVFATSGAKTVISYYYPELSGAIGSFEAGDGLNVGSFDIHSFPTPHDASSVGFRINDSEKSFFIATDMGFVTKNIYRNSLGADFAMIESNHDIEMLMSGPYPYYLKQRILSEKGHLSNADCARLVSALAKGGTRRFLLAHLSKENNTPSLAYNEVSRALEENGFSVGNDVYLDVAPGDDMTARYII